MARSKSLNLIASALLMVSLAVPAMAPQAQSAPKNTSGKRDASDPVVIIETAKGAIKLEVFKKDAPISSDNFLDLVNRGFYNGLTFHRVEPGFVIQGGDPNGNGTGDFVDPSTKRKRTIPLEVKPGLVHDKYVLAMARSNDPNSASCQFYITLADAHPLDGKYAVFGKVLEGQSVVDNIRIGDKMTKVALQAGK